MDDISEKYTDCFWQYMQAYEEYFKEYALYSDDTFSVKEAFALIAKYPPYKVTLELDINIRKTQAEIEGYLKEKFQEVLQEALSRREALLNEPCALRPLVITDIPTDSEGKNRNYQKVFKQLDNCLEAFKLYKEFEFKKGFKWFKIARKLNLIKATGEGGKETEKDKENGTREARRRVKHAETLIIAAGNGIFHKEIYKPLPRNL